MLNQKKVEIFLAKFHKSLAKQFLEVALNSDCTFGDTNGLCYRNINLPIIQIEKKSYLCNIKL